MGRLLKIVSLFALVPLISCQGCPGAPAENNAPGTEDCAAPRCTAEIVQMNHLLPHRDGTKFYQCGPGLNYYEMSCGPGTCFNYQKQICDHKFNWKNPCNDGTTTPTTEATTTSSSSSSSTTTTTPDPVTITTTNEPETTTPSVETSTNEPETTTPSVETSTNPQETTILPEETSTTPSVETSTNPQETTILPEETSTGVSSTGYPTIETSPIQDTTQAVTNNPTTVPSTQESDSTSGSTEEVSSLSTEDPSGETSETAPGTTQTPFDVTTPTTTTTTKTPFTGAICPGYPGDVTLIEAGQYSCTRPVCTTALVGIQFQSEDPQYYYECLSAQISKRQMCPGSRCFSKAANACVEPVDWVNSCTV